MDRGSTFSFVLPIAVEARVAAVPRDRERASRPAGDLREGIRLRRTGVHLDGRRPRLALVGGDGLVDLAVAPVDPDGHQVPALVGRDPREDRVHGPAAGRRRQLVRLEGDPRALPGVHVPDDELDVVGRIRPALAAGEIEVPVDRVEDQLPAR